MIEPQRIAVTTEYYDIDLMPARGLLELSMRGDWDVEMVSDFVAMLNPMVKADGVSITHSLVDAAEMGQLSPLVVEGFMPLIDPDPNRERGRIAIVQPNMLNRAQSRPVAELVNARFFASLDLARDWLFSDEA